MNDHIIIEVPRLTMSAPVALMLIILLAVLTTVMTAFFRAETLDLHNIGYSLACSTVLILTCNVLLFLTNWPNYDAAADQMNDHFGTEITGWELRDAAERIQVTPEQELRPDPVDGYVQPAQTRPASQTPSKTQTESGTRFTLAYDDLTGCTERAENLFTVIKGIIDNEETQAVNCPLNFRVTVP